MLNQSLDNLHMLLKTTANTIIWIEPCQDTLHQCGNMQQATFSLLLNKRLILVGTRSVPCLYAEIQPRELSLHIQSFIDSFI